MSGIEIDRSKMLWPIEESLTPIYTNAFAAFLSDKEAIILFGAMLPTGIIFRSTQEIDEYLKKPNITPLVKLVMSIDSFKDFVHVLQERIDYLNTNNL
ncbi:MAG: hypothetical protein WCI88_01310 [Chloroflexota bacterium]|jgi:hypothetical protein